jgi:ubiquinone/menaquinone biosynthesis C-methylase UbiE
MDTSFTEAEIQVLIALIELSQPIETPNNNHYHFFPQSMPEAAAYFKGFVEDWTPTYASLSGRGLIERIGKKMQLTVAGFAAATVLRRARPPIYYWYREFYTTAPRSPAYARFCQQLYGKALCQANFSDMAQLERLLEVLDLHPGDTALDLGCGIGLITDYLARSSGAAFTGIDYCPEAIDQAQDRTRPVRISLSFAVQNLDTLVFPPASFDALVAIDTLYMPNDLDATLRKMTSLLKPGGRMGIFYSAFLWDVGGDRTRLAAECTPLAEALASAGLRFQSWDFSAETHEHMQRKHHLAVAMRDEFAAEDSLALNDYILAESDSSSAPFDPADCTLTRYLYRVEI